MTPPDSGERAVLIATLFDAVKHGDETHQAWLRQAIADHFAGRPVQRVASGSVSVPLLLAQRILAALSAIHDAGYQALAAELREVMGK